ncbi:MAG: DUF1848 domain-containing protein [Lachnospiraceae bacterium]
MIINTGGRTDTVNYYCDWLLNRLEDGYVYSRNPLFQNKITKYELSPDKVDALIFCSKNYTPILPHIGEVLEKYNIFCHYTITAYGKDVEPQVPPIDNAMDTLIQLSNIVGKEKLAWRYDPVLLTDKYTIETHLETFEYMTEKISGYVSSCIFSFVEMYKKLATNMPELIPLTDADKNELAQGLGAIAAKYHMPIQTCGTNGDYTLHGIKASGCITSDILEQSNGCKFKKNTSHKGMREGCHCIPSRDIGAYDTCLNGCKYCYAVKNQDAVNRNYKLHDKNSPLLIGQIKDTDTIQNGAQKSLLASDSQQISLKR